MMNTIIIKNKLLATNFFVDNVYLDRYLNIISVTDLLTTKLTEKHHIIPRSYFKLCRLKIDNSKDNLVVLSIKQHIIAHYYLCLCTTGVLRAKMLFAFALMIDTCLEILTMPETKAIKALDSYAELLTEARALNKENGRVVGSLLKTEAHRAALSQARDMHSTTAGKKSIYNKVLDIVKFVLPEELDTYLASGWQLGGKPLSAEAKKKIGQSNSLALKGKKHNQIKNPGKKFSGLLGSKILCVETGQIFNNIEEAKYWLKQTVGIDGGQIKNCCTGKRETTGGYHWSYYKESE